MGARSLDLELGFRQLASMLQSGLSLVSALRTAADQAPRRAARRLWNGVADRVEMGLSPSEAFEGARRFDAYSLALVRVGGESGEMETAFARAADHLERGRAARALLVNALIYPALVLVLATGVVALMVLKVIPQVGDFLAAGQQQLPALTQALLDVSEWLRVWFPWIAGTAAVAAVAIALLRLHPPARRLLDAALLRLPLVGRLLRLSATARFSRGLSILVASGLSLVESLSIASSLLSNRALRAALDDARRAVLRGSTLADALARCTGFLPMLPKMAAVGEATGNLAQTLAENARYHEDLLLATVKRLGILVEPALVLVVGGIVGFVYTAFFMALFSLASAAS
ncbi:MAG: type II secretion system F family protein [Kiritimatiellae bacterium]|nr:type II secretion system F family protein [Kiritimatiellia bacterium]